MLQPERARVQLLRARALTLTLPPSRVLPLPQLNSPHSPARHWSQVALLVISESQGRFRPPCFAQSASNVLPAALFPADVWQTPAKIRHLLRSSVKEPGDLGLVLALLLT